MTVALNELQLMSREEILRRLSRYRGDRLFGDRNNEDVFTIKLIAKYFGFTHCVILQWFMPKGNKNHRRISDKKQILLTQFFQMIDRGELIVVHDGLRNSRVKSIVRVTPKAPPKRQPLPKIDFTTTLPTLKWD